MRRLVRNLFDCAPQDLSRFLLRERARPTGPRSISDPCQAVPLISASPSIDGVAREPEPFSDLYRGLSSGKPQQNLRTLGQLLRGVARPQPPPEFLAILPAYVRFLLERLKIFADISLGG
jgi:hypothetical protein